MEAKAPKEKGMKKKQHEIAFYSVGQCQLLVRNESEKPIEMNAISLKDFQKNGKKIHWPCISFDGIKREGRWSVY